MKYLFTILIAFITVIGVSAFTGDYDKSPPVRAVVSLSDNSYEVITVNVIHAELDQSGDNKTTDNDLKYFAVVPHTEITLPVISKQRVRWDSSAIFYTSIKNLPARENRPTLINSRSCIELNC
jgi:hypothetical protein